jgi:hypothetical protein
MDRHRPCFSSRGVFSPPTSPTATPEGARDTPAPDGSVMSLAAVRKWRAGLPGRRPASPPARHFICTIHCFRFRLPMAAGDSQCPAHLVTPLSRLKSLRRCQRRCSRRGRAEASLLTGFVHRSRLCIPPPSLAVAIALRGRVPRPYRRAIYTRSRPPRWGSLYASGPRLTTASRRQARPSGKRYLSFARSRQASLRSDCRASGFSMDGSATAKTRGRSAHPLLFGAPGRRQTDAAR